MIRYRPPNVSSVWVLIGANLVIFIVTLVSPGVLYMLGLQPATVLARPWTLLTNMFVHAGIAHVIFNMLTLFFFGTYLGRLVGEAWFLGVYFVGGLIGNAFYILLGPAYSVAVGASGAIFALGGALAVLVPRTRVFVFPIPAPIPLWAAIVGGFVLISFWPGVAWQAHLGGLLLGLLAGYFFRKRKRFYLL
ncbi:MAG: rhomboid family intramembrane serine protease [Chloroflexota bacterium]|nr:rhomboid family intramembrane serine protease [Chloroflexota bacterium]